MPTAVVYLQRWCGWCHVKLWPSRSVQCTPYNRAPSHFMQRRIRKVHACLAVTCHLHFWQIDRYLLRAAALTRGCNGYRNKSQHTKLREKDRQTDRQRQRQTQTQRERKKQQQPVFRGCTSFGVYAPCIYTHAM